MLRRYFTALVLVFCAISTAKGQLSLQNENRSYIVVPSENILLVIASQPAAPIRFEDARLLMSTDGELEISYSVRNVGTKAIRYLTPVMWTSFGTGGTLTYPRPLSNELFQPGEAVKAGQTKQIVPLSAPLREKLKLKGPMKAMIVLMVEDVMFDDGTTYNDRSASKSVLSYFEDLSDKMERLQNMERVTIKRPE